MPSPYYTHSHYHSLTSHMRSPVSWSMTYYDHINSFTRALISHKDHTLAKAYLVSCSTNHHSTMSTVLHISPGPHSCVWILHQVMKVSWRERRVYCAWVALGPRLDDMRRTWWSIWWHLAKIRLIVECAQSDAQNLFQLVRFNHVMTYILKQDDATFYLNISDFILFWWFSYLE